MARADDLVVTLPRSSTAPAISGRVLLDGASYSIRLAFNVRDRRWYADVGTAAGEVIVQGTRVVAGVALLGAHSDDRLPPGQLFVEDSRGLGEPPDRTAWTDWATLYYRPASVVLLADGTADEVF